MYAITGITGRVGGAAARALLGRGENVRAIVRSTDKGRSWSEKGCDVALAAIDDAVALTKAFAGADGVFLMTPPNYDPEPGFPQTRKILDAVSAAIKAARPGRVVYLSTVGAQASQENLLTNATIMEQGLRALSVSVTLLRPAWFMENSAWDVAAARGGHMPSYLQPLDHPIPMIATADIGVVVADLLQQTWTGTRIVELEAPRRYSANDIGRAFAETIGRRVHVEAVPCETWEATFRSQGMKHPVPRMRMIDGFNEGWIDFEGGAAEHWTGQTPLEAVVRNLVKAAD
ncbi:NmrA family NAD(P)-binding protein [Bradyrhizobium sp. SYSU BS000235]|uniref:NmrA family NAD(P)-binding protein n=1 Tax=Bradyrhizobium sp. SYSU BS000235 TaxID=3411332 RepID=UPI003C752438